MPTFSLCLSVSSGLTSLIFVVYYPPVLLLFTQATKLPSVISVELVASVPLTDTAADKGISCSDLRSPTLVAFTCVSTKLEPLSTFIVLALAILLLV